MKHLKTFEDITKVNNDLPIDKTDKFKYKKDPRKFSYNQKRPDKEGVFLGKNNKWQTVVKNVNTGNFKMIYQNIDKKLAQKEYDDYYKNNKKTKKTYAKDDDVFKSFYNKNVGTNMSDKVSKKNYYNPNQPNETDWVIVNFNITEYKVSETDQKFIDFINNKIGRIKLKQSNDTFIVEYKRIPDDINDYFVDDSKMFNLKDIKHYSKVRKDLLSYIIKKEPKPKPEINLDGDVWNFYRKKLGKLPEIREGVKTLSCSDNNLTSIPKLPTSLKKLTCNKNEKLLELPELPEGLLELDCRNLNIKELPKLPSTLTRLNCGGCRNLTEIPELPESLIGLYVSDCSLTTLPKLPEGLISLMCRDNNLKYLPEIPETSSLRVRMDGNYKLPYSNMVEYKKYINKYKNFIDRVGYDSAMEQLYNVRKRL